MKTYGLKREEIRAEVWAVTETWTGRQSRKVARRRKTDKKLLHRRARRTAGSSQKPREWAEESGR